MKRISYDEIKLENNDTLIVGCIYKSPNCTKENYALLVSLFYKISVINPSNLIITGDFNFSEINWENNTTSVGENNMATQFLNCIMDEFLFQHVRHPTRIRTGNVPSILDLIFTNEENMVEEVEFLPGLGLSDHLVLYCDFNCYIEQDNPSYEKLNYFRGDYRNIGEELSSVQWDSVMRGLDVSDSWNGFTEKIVKLLEKHVPVSKSTPSKGKRSPFITTSCKEALRHKHTRWKKFTYCKSDENYNKYKQARNKVTTELRHSKYKYEQDISSQRLKTENKLFWKYVRSKTKTNQVVSKLEKTNGELTKQ